MKRIYTTAALLGALVTGAFAQRQSNMTPIMFSPVAGQTMVIDSTDGEDSYLAYGFKNLGPNALLAGDTLFYADPFGANGVILSVGIPVNDTVFLGIDTVKISNGPATGAFDWCLSFIQFGLDTVNPVVIDPVDGNNETCHSVNLVNRNGTSSIFDVFKDGKANALNIYPNPVNNEVNFKFEFTNTTTSTVRITDLTGRTILVKEFGKQSFGEKQLSVNVSSLLNGMYYIELITDDKRAISKMTIKK